MAELGVFGVGVATVDPESRSVGNNGATVCTTSLAFNRSYQDKDGNWQKEPCFLRVQMWGPRGQRMAELVKKGTPVYVAGYLKQDSWEDDQGNKKTAYSITLKDFQVCERNGKKNGNTSPPANTNAGAVSNVPETNDDLPF